MKMLKRRNLINSLLTYHIHEPWALKGSCCLLFLLEKRNSKTMTFSWASPNNSYNKFQTSFIPSCHIAFWIKITEALHKCNWVSWEFAIFLDVFSFSKRKWLFSEMNITQNCQDVILLKNYSTLIVLWFYYVSLFSLTKHLHLLAEKCEERRKK